MANYSDIPKGGWIEKILPKVARPYAILIRLDRAIGTWLLLLPCWWSLARLAVKSGQNNALGTCLSLSSIQRRSYCYAWRWLHRE